MLHIYLLGNPQIFDDDRPLPLPAPDRVVALWAYLLLQRDRPVPREPLAYLLWPDVPESEARANLRRHLHLLRKQLPPAPQGAEWILATRSTLRWNPDAAYRLDVALLDQLDVETAGEEEWTALIESYRGDLLEGFYDDWVLAERARLRQRYIHLLEQRILLQKERGDLRGAIRTTQRLLVCDPLREEPYRHLMELYYRLGDRAAALRAFEKCRDMMRVELDAEPMPETLALRDAILRGETWTPLPEPAPKAPPPRPERPGTADQPVSTEARRLDPAPTPSAARRLWRGRAVGLLLALVVTGGLLVARWLSPSEPVTISISGPAAVQDTWLNGEIPDLPYDPNYSEDPYAIYPQVHLSYWGYPYDRVLIRFDLDQLPPGAEVQQALFHLYLESFLNEDVPEPLPATVSAFRMLVPWEQNAVTFNSPWSQPGLAPGVDYEAEPLDSDSRYGNGWVDLDVTEAVRHWQAHPADNFGLVVMITEAPRGAHYWVNTTDYPLSNRRPHLDITYMP